MWFAPNIQPETFAQANPFLTGFNLGNQALASFNQAQYSGPLLAQALLKNKIANYQALQYAQLSPQMAEAQLQQAQEVPKLTAANIQNVYQGQIPLEQAQATAQRALPGLYGAEAAQNMAMAALTAQRQNLLAQQTPALVQGAYLSNIKSPMMQRLAEETYASRNPGVINPALLAQIGINPNPQLANQSNQQTAPLRQSSVNGVLPFVSAGRQQGVTPVTEPRAFMGMNPQQNYALFGSPIGPLAQMQIAAMQKGMQQNAVNQANAMNEYQTQAAKSAQQANQVQQTAQKFNTAYQNTPFTGTFLGRPGITNILPSWIPGVQNAQVADISTAQLVADVAKEVVAGRVSNYEWQGVQRMKLNRQLGPVAEKEIQANTLLASQRAQEEPQFLLAAQSAGIDNPQLAKTLWTQYINQRPVYNFSTNTPNKGFMGSYRDFLTPTAIRAAENGIQYVPIPQQFLNSEGLISNKQLTNVKNWINTLTPQDRQYVDSILRGNKNGESK